MVSWFLVAILAAFYGSVPISGAWPPSSASLKGSDNPPSVITTEDDPVLCEDAHLKCAYRKGCGNALKSYMSGCLDVISGRTNKCTDHCKHALIALTSTEEGQRLMTCQCTDEFCLQNKRRIEICRPDVILATRNVTAMSCTVAQWICVADSICSTALEYYHLFCRMMFQGKKCTHRCNNSISILRRQEKAQHLGTCICDGTEDYDCKQIRKNMDVLCFHKKPVEEETNNIDESTENSTSNDIPKSSSNLNANVTLSGMLVISVWTWIVTVSSRWTFM